MEPPARYVREQEREQKKRKAVAPKPKKVRRKVKHGPDAPQSKKRKVPAKPKQQSPKRRKTKPRENHVEIYIDAKEPMLPDIVRAIYPDLSESNFKLGTALPTGDIRVDVNGAPCLLIERKEVHDFVSSLGTGNHFREQRARMLQDREEHPHLILMVMMEGSFDSVDWTKRVKLTREYCEGICRDLVYKYNIHVVWTKDQLGIIQYLGHVEKCYTKYGSPASVIADTDYLNNFYVGRKRALRQEEYSYMALTLIEGVSTEIAKAVMNVHDFLPNLIAAYNMCDNEEQRESLLQDITHGDAERRIGPVLSKRVYNFLFDTTPE
jgi:ERCC4-type nuclease